MKEDPPVDARCRDKFLVQSVAIPGEQEMENMTAVVSVYLFSLQVEQMLIYNSGKTLRRPPAIPSKNGRFESFSFRHMDPHQLHNTIMLTAQ